MDRNNFSCNLFPSLITSADPPPRGAADQSTTNIMNLSKSFIPTAAQVKLLERGLTFIPRPNKFDWEELQRDTHKYHRRLKLLDYFDYNTDDNHLPFTLPSTWEPKTSQIDGRIRRLIRIDKNTLHNHQTHTDREDNLTHVERQVIKQLKNNPHIIIKPADKGSKIVILDKHQYMSKASYQTPNIINK